MKRLLAFALALGVSSAGAHMDYPPRCCGGRDCAPLVGIGEVQRRDAGWFIKATGEVIPFDKTEPSTDLEFHRCVRPDGTTRCFFSPESGT